VHRKCRSKRTYYIPVDPTIRKVLIFHPKCVPHNHPIAPPLKLSHDAKSHFLKCVHAVGLIGTSVAKVDNGITFFRLFIWYPYLIILYLAPSTQLLLGGKRPGQFAAGLHNTRLKQDILGNEKKKKYPAGLGVTGEAPSYILLPDFADHASKARTTYITRTSKNRLTSGISTDSNMHQVAA
jgi:hypothetical protein